MKKLPDLPDQWKDRYQEFEAGRWYGWLSRDFSCHEAQAVLSNPAGLMEEHNVRKWYKRHRNLLAEVCWPEESSTGHDTVVLKQYVARTAFHALRFRFGENRAVRHWNNAWLLKQRGINTPLPIFIALNSSDTSSQGIIAVETVHAHLRAREVFARGEGSSGPGQAESQSAREIDLARCLGRYVREIHDCGIVHRDFSASNVLIPENWDRDSSDLKSRFVLLDINRARAMAPKQISENLRIQDLERINLPEDLVDELFCAYAGNSDEIVCFRQKFLKYRHSYRRIRGTRNSLIRGLLKVFTYWPRTG